MPSEGDITSIPITVGTRERLKQLGKKGETYDTIIRRLMDNMEEEIDVKARSGT